MLHQALLKPPQNVDSEDCTAQGAEPERQGCFALQQTESLISRVLHRLIITTGICMSNMRARTALLDR